MWATKKVVLPLKRDPDTFELSISISSTTEVGSGEIYETHSTNVGNYMSSSAAKAGSGYF